MAALEKHGGGIVCPMEDPSLMWLAENAEKVRTRGGVFLLPPLESLRIAQDKGRTLDLARELGIPAPKTWAPESAREFAAKVLQLRPGEFVTKPRSGTGSSGVKYGDALTEEQWLEHWKLFGAMLIQERVPAEGRGQGVSVLMDQKGECIAAFAHERLQQYPNSGGPSTDRQSIEAPELIEWSVRLLKKLSWRGIAMVEWKLDPRDGKAKLMEINPRFWGSLELAVRSGIDFPKLYAEAALGNVTAKVERYPAQVRCRWMIPGEILRYLTQEKSRRESLLRFLRGLPGMAEEWDRTDLRGALATLICTAALALNPKYWKYVLRG